MREQLLGMKPPDKYTEGLIQYVEGVDNIPELPEYLRVGFNRKEAEKMDKLVRIEWLKNALVMGDLEDKDTPDEELKKHLTLDMDIRQTMNLNMRCY